MQVDYLIIGQGLAGSMLAWQLMQRGLQVLVVDNAAENASQIAAGIINPVTGMRLVRADDSDALLTAAISCYAQLGNFFNQTFYQAKPMLRLFQNTTEAAAGHKRLQQGHYQAYLNGIATAEQLAAFNAPYGGVWQNQTGYLSTMPLLAALKLAFNARNCLRETRFSFANLQMQPTLQWQGIRPKRLIFCEGYHLQANPWFSWLPLQPVKGEILTLQTLVTLPEAILNFGHWLLPQTSQQFRIGASFDRHTINTQPTLQGRQSLVAALANYSQTLAAAEVCNHQANLRPCTVDRQPLIGQHPYYHQLYVFNGFGAKGSMQIPWYSQHFTDYLCQAKPLLASCDIQRFKANYRH